MPRRLWLIVIVLSLSALYGAQPPRACAPAPAAAHLRYANMPLDAVAFRHFAKPYHEWYLAPETLRLDQTPNGVTPASARAPQQVAIGLLGPIEHGAPGHGFGLQMLWGAQMAVARANARGGFHRRPGDAGIPYALDLHNDSALWGSSSNEIADMVFRQHVWAMLGSINAVSTHVALRVALKLGLPIVNTGTSDPTLTETRVPWLLRDFPDDRQQGYALANAILHQRKLTRVAVLMSVSRYGRLGVSEFVNVARRVGAPPVAELEYDPAQASPKRAARLARIIAATHPQAILLWGGPAGAARQLRALRAAQIQAPVFGGSRLCTQRFLQAAGPAANGMVVTCALDPTRTNPRWQAFRRSFERRYHRLPDAYAARAYDGMNILIGAIQRGGLSRSGIMRALMGYEMNGYCGVSGPSFFDHTLNDIAPVPLARVENGHFIFEHRSARR